MFSVDGVTLRPLEPSDLETLYGWMTDTELELWGGWVPLASRAAFIQRWTRRLEEPKEEMAWFVFEAQGKPAGFAQLALIERVERRAAVGIAVGDKTLWGQGIGGAALRLLLDYAFTVLCLERVYAEVFTFNQRSMRMMERVGFTREGTLRQHEYHNGARQDMHLYGILRAEFYQRHQTIFTLPPS